MLVPCNMTLYFLLNEDFLLMSSLPRCLIYSFDELSKRSELFDLPSTLSCFWLCHVNNFACYPCVDNLSWSVECWPSSLPCKQLGVVRCLDEFSWSVECLPGSCLRHINNSVWTLKCLQCSPRASCYLEQVAGGSCFWNFYGLCPGLVLVILLLFWVLAC